ncbi:MAG TPA: NADH-quinone oxidoreductase subunit J [Burkholderiaceae bacterium]|nr:NADH-quinone oxidoreductase subunit J [Burkholderiaceae bacterium]
MDFKTVVFIVFSAILVVAALRVITARNPVHAALYLVLSFFSASGVWMLLQAEFLAITLVLVYVGAVMVLFLFVVMMLDINIDALREGFRANLASALFVGLVVILELAFVIISAFRTPDPYGNVNAMPPGSNTHNLGKLLYTEYLYPFEIAGAILLVAMVAAIALTLRRRKDSKSQKPGEQIAVRAQDRVRLVKIPAVVRERSASEPGHTPENT